MEFTLDELKVLAFVINNKLELNNIFNELDSGQIGSEIGLTSHFTRKALKSLVEKGIIESNVKNSVRTTVIKTTNN